MEDVQAIFEKVFTTPDFIDNLTDEEICRAINMTITEYFLKAESVSSLVQDKIVSLLNGRAFLGFEETIRILSRQSENEIRERIKKLLFAN